MKYLAPHKGIAIFIVIVIVISSLLFGCTKQKLEPMTNIWVSPCYIPGWLYNEAGEYLHVVYDDAYHTKDASPVTADSTMEILEESTWHDLLPADLTIHSLQFFQIDFGRPGRIVCKK